MKEKFPYSSKWVTVRLPDGSLFEFFNQTLQLASRYKESDVVSVRDREARKIEIKPN